MIAALLIPKSVTKTMANGKLLVAINTMIRTVAAIVPPKKIFSVPRMRLRFAIQILPIIPPIPNTVINVAKPAVGRAKTSSAIPGIRSVKGRSKMEAAAAIRSIGPIPA